MVEQLKKSWIVMEARYKFLLNGSKPLIRWDAPFGILGAAVSSTTTEQFVGGARVSIVPTSAGLFFEVNDTKNNNSFFLHATDNNPGRVNGMGGAFSTTYQRYIWFEPNK